MSDLLLSRATPADAVAGARLHVTCWDEAYRGRVPDDRLDAQIAAEPERVASWRIWATRETAPMLARTDDGDLVGFASAGPSRPGVPTALQLYALYVRRALWSTGLGHRLFTAVVGDAPCTAWVLADNPRALAFYARHGMVPDGHTTHDDDWGAEVRVSRP